MILSPSLIRPSFAAMLFGSTFKKDRKRRIRHLYNLLHTSFTSFFPTSDFLSHLADVDAGLVLVVGPVADGQAQLVLDVGSVQIHLLFTVGRTLSASGKQKLNRLFSFLLSGMRLLY